MDYNDTAIPHHNQCIVIIMRLKVNILLSSIPPLLWSAQKTCRECTTAYLKCNITVYTTINTPLVSSCYKRQV